LSGLFQGYLDVPKNYVVLTM